MIERRFEHRFDCFTTTVVVEVGEAYMAVRTFTKWDGVDDLDHGISGRIDGVSRVGAGIFADMMEGMLGYKTPFMQVWDEANDARGLEHQPSDAPPKLTEQLVEMYWALPGHLRSQVRDALTRRDR